MNDVALDNEIFIEEVFFSSMIQKSENEFLPFAGISPSSKSFAENS